jgi:DNA polymerase III delta prime subunit
MPNIATVPKEEIVRLARKEIRKQTNVLGRAAAQYRRDIAEMKRRVSELRRKVTPPREATPQECAHTGR